MPRLPHLPRPGRTRLVGDDATPRTVHRACTLCEANCGLAVTVAGNEVVEIRGDADDPRSRGYICPKALGNADLLADPDRLRQPVVRDGAEWRTTTWDEAYEVAAHGLAEVVREHGPDAVAVYVGNPAIHGTGTLIMVNELVSVLGTRRRYSAASLDQAPQQLVSQLLYGSPVLFPVSDLDRTDFLLVLGGNPAVSNGSIMAAPDMRRRIRAIRERGGRVVVVDPRRTETARLADQHLFVRPGTDVWLLASLLHVVVDEGLMDLGAGQDYVAEEGVAAVAAVVAEYSPERTAAVTGVPADEVRVLARAFAGAPSAVAYGRLGVAQTRFGTSAFWLLTCLNILTGNLDRPGGVMFPTPAVDVPTLLSRLPGLVGYDRYRSRVGDLPEVSGELPSATLAREMLTPGPGQVRALVTVAGNPVLSVPGGRDTDAALESLGFMVALDPYVTETSRHADVVLPPRTGFERDDYEAVAGLVAVRNYARFSPRVVDPPPDTRDDAANLAGVVRLLARRVGSPPARARALAMAELVRRGGVERLLDLGLRTGPYGGARVDLAALSRGGPLGGLTLQKVKRAPQGVDLGPLRPSLPGRLLVPGKRIRLDNPVLMADVARLREEFEAAATGASSGPDDLLLIGRRHVRTNNSWMANSPRLVRGRNRCTVLVHPDDAVARGISDGQTVRLTSVAGSVDVPAEISDEVMVGVVSMPHGWGHDRPGVGWRVAAEHPGVSVNDVTDPTVVDPLSGNAALQAVSVRLEAVPTVQPA